MPELVNMGALGWVGMRLPDGDGRVLPGDEEVGPGAAQLGLRYAVP